MCKIIAKFLFNDTILKKLRMLDPRNCFITGTADVLDLENIFMSSCQDDTDLLTMDYRSCTDDKLTQFDPRSDAQILEI